MISVKLGAKAKSYGFNVADLDPSLVDRHPDKTTISSNGTVSLYSDNNDYVTLKGDFNISKLRSDPDQAIRHLDAVTMVENGKVLYSAISLGMVGSHFATEDTFRAYLDSQSYSIKGNDTANEIAGASVKDLLHGASGNDTLFGLAGNDRLYGEAGADILNGGLGGDQLFGGKGADVFVFVAGDGNDVIKDFNTRSNAHDVIDLSDRDGVASYEDLDISQSGSQVTIDFGVDGSIVLKNHSIEDMHSSLFIF